MKNCHSTFKYKLYQNVLKIRRESCILPILTMFIIGVLLFHKDKHVRVISMLHNTFDEYICNACTMVKEVNGISLVFCCACAAACVKVSTCAELCFFPHAMIS